VNPNRTIFTSLFFVWAFGFLKSDKELAGGATGAFSNVVTRTVGVSVAGIMLSAMTATAPKVASGFALLIALTAAGFRSEAIADTVSRITDPNVQAAKRIGSEVGKEYR